MRAVSQQEKETWLSGCHKYLTLTFDDGTVLDNSDIVSESMSLEQSICKDGEVLFGQCSASCFQVQIIQTGSKRYKGQWFRATLRAGSYTRPLGRFKVDSDVATSDRLHRDLMCYDALADVLSTNYAEWHNALTFPMTVRQYRDAFFSHVGITQVATTLVNDSISISRNFVAENYSGSDVLKSICELNGTFGFINFDGRFQYVVFTSGDDALYPSNELYPSTTIYPKDWVARRIGGASVNSESYIQGSLTYEDYSVQRITQVQIRQTENDVGAVVGSEGNTYIIQNNPLLYGKTTAQLQTVGNNFLRYVTPLVYRPSSVQVYGAPWQELGDSVGIYSSDGQDIIMFILNRTMSGITALLDTYTATGEEYYTEKANSTNFNVLVLERKTNELVRTVEETSSTITQVETDLNNKITTQSSRITQNANQITAEVKRASAAEGTLSSRITQTVNKISFKVTNGETSSTLSLTVTDGVSSTTIKSDAITFTGLVTIKSLQAGGSTVIDGSRITTGSIKDKNSNVVFDLTNGTLTMKRGSININNKFIVDTSGNLTATSATLNGKLTTEQSSLKTIIDKGIWTVYYNNAEIGSTGRFTLNNKNTFGLAVKSANAGGFTISVDDTVYYGLNTSKDKSQGIDFSGYGFRHYFNGDVYCTGTFKTSNGYGWFASNRDGEPYVKTGANVQIGEAGSYGVLYTLGNIYTDGQVFDQMGNVRDGWGSDRRLKTDIETLELNSAKNTIMKLRPVSYNFIESPERKRHGFIAQEAKEVSDWDVTFVGKNGMYGLSYIDFIADLVKVVQNQEERIEQLEKSR